MNDTQLQRWLAESGNGFVYFYRTTDSNGEVLLLILDYNGHELARKVFKPQATDWDETFIPKVWVNPLPEEPDDIDLQPAHRFITEIAFRDIEYPSSRPSND